MGLDLPHLKGLRATSLDGVTVTLRDLAADHRRLRELLADFEAHPEACPQRAKEFSAELARHQHTCTDLILGLDAADVPLGIDRRLLVSTTRGVDHLAIRLQSPCRGADTRARLLVAIRELLFEHERIECELVNAVDAAPDRWRRVAPVD